jgi:hypothetical protein
MYAVIAHRRGADSDDLCCVRPDAEAAEVCAGAIRRHLPGLEILVVDLTPIQEDHAED